jgi:type IV secretory pathway VirB9-like protein
MKRNICIFLLAPLLVCSNAFATPTRTARQRPPAKAAPAAVAPEEPVEGDLTAKVVQYGEKDVIRVKTMVRYSTLIVLPKEEEILDFTCGDKEFWVVDGAQNFAHVKPAKPGARTNLNLIAASGNIYSFVLKEVSGSSESEPDLKVFVELREGAMRSALGDSRFVSKQEADDYRQEAEQAKAEARRAKEDAQTTIEREINKYRAVYPIKLKSVYQFEANKPPFFVSAIYHDDRFTFIQARPEEVPAVYEIKDGKPNLVDFEYTDGTYAVAKILDSGYLAIGKRKLRFTRKED